MSLSLVPCSLKDAAAFIRQFHRHHRPPQKKRFAVAVALGEDVVAVAVVGDPAARMLDDGWTAEVLRVCVSANRLTGGLLCRALGLNTTVWLFQHHLAVASLLSLAGARNACSMLYGAAWRAARALGYRRCVTYTLPEEGGYSLRGGGMRELGKAGGGSWSRKSRPRVDHHPTQKKLRWEVAR